MATGEPAGETTVTTRRRLLRQAERQEQILRTAATAFARGGFAATSMDEVAAEAGVTRLIVYRHFASKEQLYRDILERVAARLRDEFMKGVQDQRGRFVLESMLRVARENPDGFRLLTGHALREVRFASYYERWWDQAVRLADAMAGTGIADPTFRAWTARLLVAYLVDAIDAWLAVGEAARDAEFVERANNAITAMYEAWSSWPGTPPDDDAHPSRQPPQPTTGHH
jgi:AcrR family transcriptional regulator